MKDVLQKYQKLSLNYQQWSLTTHQNSDYYLFADENASAILTQLHLRKRVAIIGSRQADSYGLNITSHIAKIAAANQIMVISGAAQGIDRYAHQSCLEASGQTFAVLGHGLDHTSKSLWPLQKQGLALCSPFSNTMTARKWTFIKRNAWIAGLSQAIIVVQAGIDSGALYTARVALQHGIPVWVVPSLLTDPLFEGNAALLQEGAKILTTLDQWISDLEDKDLGFMIELCVSKTSQMTHHPRKHPIIKKQKPPSHLSLKLWSHASVEALSISDLASLSDMSVQDALKAATLLELNGWLISYPGGRYVKSHPQ